MRNIDKKYSDYIVTENYSETEDTFILRLRPREGSLPSFLPGQYVYIKNPAVKNFSQAHPFSIASSPTNKEYLEFCIKKYGTWTQFLSTMNKGDTLLVSSPTGKFTLNNSVIRATFLVGGIGISPIMSMLRFLAASKQSPHLVLIYGNRTPATIVYRKELTTLQSQLELKIIDVFSHLPNAYPWAGYKGFITGEILEKEVDVLKNDRFFIVGPSVFVDQMDAILANFTIPQVTMRHESIQ